MHQTNYKRRHISAYGTAQTVAEPARLKPIGKCSLRRAGGQCRSNRRWIHGFSCSSLLHRSQCRCNQFLYCNCTIRCFIIRRHMTHPVILTRTFHQGPGPGLGCQGPGPKQGLHSQGLVGSGSEKSTWRTFVT